MKIILKGKYTGEQILEAFGKCGTALQKFLFVDDAAYQLIPTDGDFEGISIGPMEIIRGQGAKLIPKVPVTRRKYIFFGSKETIWEQTVGLMVYLKSIFPKKEYEAVEIYFLVHRRNVDGDLEEVGIRFGSELFEDYKLPIGIFLGALADNLKEAQAA